MGAMAFFGREEVTRLFLSEEFRARLELQYNCHKFGNDRHKVHTSDIHIGRIFISFCFSDLPRAPAPSHDHGLWIFTRVNVRPQQQ